MRGAKENRCLADFLVTIPGQCVLTTSRERDGCSVLNDEMQDAPMLKAPACAWSVPMTKDETPRRLCGGGSCCSIYRPIGDRIFPLCRPGGMEPRPGSGRL